MPKVKLTDDDLSELIDLVTAEIDRVRKVALEVVPNGPTAVEMQSKEQHLLELLETLEDAV